MRRSAREVATISLPARLRALGELDAGGGEQRQRLVEDPALGQAPG